jgi:CBS domain-containing protein
MNINDIVGRPVRAVRPSNTLVEAAGLMCRHSVGALILTDESEETPLGVVTDRDLVWMISEGLDPATATVDELVRAPLETIGIAESLSDATTRMRRAGVRRLPVVDAEGRLVGLLSLDDVLALLGRELADIAEGIRGELAHERTISAAHEAARPAKRPEAG